MLASMDSHELSGWLALLKVKEDEREAAETIARMKADSDDGQVIEYNKPLDETDDEVDNADGPPEQ